MSNIYWDRPRYVEKYFWSLKEVLDPTDSKADYLINNSDILTIVASMTGYTTPLISGASWSKTQYADVMNLLVKRFLHHYCYNTLASEFSVSEQKNFIAKLLGVLEMTSPRYNALIKAYTDSETKLLDPVKNKTTSVSKFNDTPQNTGDYSTDPYTTNVTRGEVESENDLDTKMGRLRELEYYQNLILNWSNEFSNLFLEEDNI